MYAIKPIITAGLFAALGLAPAAFAQSAAPTAAPSAQSTAPSTPSTTPATSGTTAQAPSSTTSPQQSGADSQGGGNQEVARQALAAARQSLAELTKMPEAQKLQGEQRTTVATFISDFNAFATAQTDWRSKYQVVDESLNRLLGEASAAPSASSTTSTDSSAASSTASPTAGAAGASGTSAAGSGGIDPAIVAKLQEVRTHLNEFEQASGDPLFAVDAIQKQLDAASAGASASGVTLSAAQVEDIRKQLETIRQAAKK